MCVPFVRHILMDIRYILIGNSILVICAYCSLSWFEVSFYCVSSFNAIFMSLFLNSFVIVLVSGQYCVQVVRFDFCVPCDLLLERLCLCFGCIMRW
jgi:predicted ferric reductase